MSFLIFLLYISSFIFFGFPILDFGILTSFVPVQILFIIFLPFVFINRFNFQQLLITLFIFLCFLIYYIAYGECKFNLFYLLSSLILAEGYILSDAQIRKLSIIGSLIFYSSIMFSGLIVSEGFKFYSGDPNFTALALSLMIFTYSYFKLNIRILLSSITCLLVFLTFSRCGFFFLVVYLSVQFIPILKKYFDKLNHGFLMVFFTTIWVLISGLLLGIIFDNENPIYVQRVNLERFTFDGFRDSSNYKRLKGNEFFLKPTNLNKVFFLGKSNNDILGDDFDDLLAKDGISILRPHNLLAVMIFEFGFPVTMLYFIILFNKKYSKDVSLPICLIIYGVFQGYAQLYGIIIFTVRLARFKNKFNALKNKSSN